MKDNLQVMKFGGTSVGDSECIKRAAEIVARASREGAVLVVVSAMSGATNQLILAAEQSKNGDETKAREIAAALRNQHNAAVTALIKDEARRFQLTRDVEQIIGEVTSLCRGITLLRELTLRTLAVVSSIGERLSARLMAGALHELCVRIEAIEATEVIITDDDYGQAEPLMEKVRERAAARLGALLG